MSAIVQAWVNGTPNHGFVLLPETTNGGNLATNAHANPRSGRCSWSSTRGA